MTPLAHLALLGIIPYTLLLFMLLDPRRAVLTAFITAWLFLPVAGYHLPGLPDYDRYAATAVPVFLGIALFDTKRILAFQPSLFDLPIIAWCVAPFMASVTNGLGPYDGMAGLAQHSITYGLPWFIGRLYFSTPEHLKQLAIAIAIGGMLYVPLAFWEARMSPQLHNIIYGFHQHSFLQHIRGFFHRPMLFLQHGLAVSTWLAMATIAAYALWRDGAHPRLMFVPMPLVFLALLAATIITGSLGPFMLFAMAFTLLLVLYYFPPRPILMLCLGAIPLFLFARISGGFTGDSLVRLLEPFAPEARISSFQARLDAENALRDHAMSRPLFGWGGYGRSRVPEAGDEVGVLDSMWIITLGRYGLLGLVSFLSLLILPPLLIALRLPARVLRSRSAAPILALTLALFIYLYDNMVNAMTNPILLLTAAALLSTAIAYQPQTSHTAHHAQRRAAQAAHRSPTVTAR